MRLNNRQQRQIIATLEHMRLEIEAAGLHSKVAQEEMAEIDRRLERLKKLAEEEQTLVRSYRER